MQKLHRIARTNKSATPAAPAWRYPVFSCTAATICSSTMPSVTVEQRSSAATTSPPIRLPAKHSARIRRDRAHPMR